MSLIAIKGHVNNAAHQPEHIAWLLAEVDSPHLLAAYDFSHFQLRERKLAETWQVLAKQTAFIHVKDATGEPGKFKFLLPGDGTIDYPALAKLLRESDYRGCVMIEVSGQISGQPGYDPIAAAKKCYVALSPAFKA